MTAIVGLLDEGRVLLGGDSAGVGGYRLTVRKDSKVFTNGAYVMGFTSSFRMGQILRWAFTPPTPPEDQADLERFMATTWIDALRQALKDGGYATKDQEQEQGGNFLVGVQGRLFEIGSDYQVGEPLDGYAAVGCGEQIAQGVLYATQDQGERAAYRVNLALEAAERHSAGVRGPFTLVWEPAAEESKADEAA